MKIDLALLGLIILLRHRSEADFLRHVVLPHEAGGRTLQSCNADCEYNMCTVEGEAECLREAEESADQKWAWCVGLDGNYGKWKDGTCGSMLHKPKYNCVGFSGCVKGMHCSLYRSAGCDASQAEDKAKWVLDSCQAGQYEKIDAWNPACFLDDFPFEDDKDDEEYDCGSFQICIQDHHCLEYPSGRCDSTEAWNKSRWAKTKCDDGEYGQADSWKNYCPLKKYMHKPVKEINCPMFSSCVRTNHCKEYPTAGCDGNESDDKANWALNSCKADPTKANQWKKYCPVENYPMDPVCDAFRGCMVKVKYNQNIANKLDSKVSTCMFERRFESQCDDECNANCPCDETDMTDCAEKYDECRAENNSSGSKKCFKNAQKKSYRDCCCLDKDCMDSAEGFEGCGFLMKYNNRAGTGTSDDPPLPIDYCSPDPCKNDGMCINDQAKKTFVCKCAKGYEGDWCEQEIDYCSAPTRCGSHGVCFNKPGTANGFVCDCEPRYQGTFCEQEINFCSTNLCGNHGTCINRSSGYICLCDPGYEGEFCKKEKDYCKSNPCLNGSCENDPSKETYKCQCDRYWRGNNCQFPVNRCGSAPCLNGGTCQNNPSMNDGYECFCRDNYAGKNCEFDFGAAIEFRYDCDLNTACRCYDSDCVHSRGSYESYEGIGRGECERMCNENGRCNG